MSTVSVRYFVDDVDAAVDFYTQHLSFVIAMCVDPMSGDDTECDMNLRQTRS